MGIADRDYMRTQPNSFAKNYQKKPQKPQKPEEPKGPKLSLIVIAVIIGIALGLGAFSYFN